jgi:hypothetical protein
MPSIETTLHNPHRLTRDPAVIPPHHFSSLQTLQALQAPKETQKVTCVHTAQDITGCHSLTLDAKSPSRVAMMR